MWSFERSKAGFSVTEMLVVLAILALSVGAFATTLRPSGTLNHRADIAAAMKDASRARIQAIADQTTQRIDLSPQSCHQTAQSLTFFADGTAIPARICIGDRTHHSWLLLDPLTGSLRPEHTP